MTPKTDLKPLLAAHYAALAGATMACPKLWNNPETNEWHEADGFYWTGQKEHPPHCICQGTDEVAAFEGFRQPCLCRESKNCVSCGWVLDNYVHSISCRLCNGLGWQVRAVGSFDALAAALAGLTRGQALAVYAHVVGTMELDVQNLEDLKDPMPDADALSLRALELVCRIKEIEVADATD